MVTKATLPTMEEYVAELKDIWESHWLTNFGHKYDELKDCLKEFLQTTNLELVVNGHMAMELSLQALALEKGGEVITSPFTFASTTHAIVRAGLIPVFCDINPDDFTIDVQKIPSLITTKTVAILPIHVYGHICDISRIQRIAADHNLKVIYDGAHAFGEEWRGKQVSSFGDMTCLSFHATKVFHTIEGGAVCFQDELLTDKIQTLSNHGIRNEEEVTEIGTNAKMNEFCAAMGLCNLRYFERGVESRKRIAETYRRRLSEVRGIRFTDEDLEVKSNYGYFPILVEEKEFGMDRDQLLVILAKKGVVGRKYFYPITSAFDCYKGLYDPRLTPVAQRVSKQVITLPIYGDLKTQEVDWICDIIKDARRP